MKLLSAASADAEYDLIRSFGIASQLGFEPETAVVQASDGWLYGTTVNGGVFLRGTVFRAATDGSAFQVIHHFSGGEGGADARGTIIEASDGAMYGTTTHGGKADQGTVFRLNRDGSDFRILHHFSAEANDGRRPYAGVIEGSDGLLYGTTVGGGSNGSGTVFVVAKDGTTYSRLRSLGAVRGDAAGPESSLIEGLDGWLYGTSFSGGTSDKGAVFKISKDGSSYFVLHNFLGSPSDGERPMAKLLEGPDGRLYGTTSKGGPFRAGTVFTLTKDGTHYALILTAAGRQLEAGLASSVDGFFYGTAAESDPGTFGSLFRVRADGSGFQQIYSFPNLLTGALPAAELAAGSDGFLYGTTRRGGGPGFGVLFKIQPNNSSSYQVLKEFSLDGGGCRFPQDGVIEATDGRFYGVTREGGRANLGTLFRVDRDGSGLAVLHHFGIPESDGVNPLSALVEGPDGRLYGVTPDGGILDRRGTFFRINTEGGGYEILWRFARSGTSANGPSATLIKARDGYLYGATPHGQPLGAGSIFRFSIADNRLEVLYTHPPSPLSSAHLWGDLIEGSNGYLYGTINEDPLAGTANVFRVGKNGTGFEKLPFLKGPSGQAVLIKPGLMEGSDGKLYAIGGWRESAIVSFAMDGSALKILHTFSERDGTVAPMGGLIETPGGFLYGRTFRKSILDREPNGTVFRIRRDATGFKVVKTFGLKPGDGKGTPSRLFLSTDGSLYGTTTAGGDAGDNGVLFRIRSAPERPSLALQPSGRTGLALYIRGLPMLSVRIQQADSISGPWTDMGLWTLDNNGVAEAPLSNLAGSSHFYRAMIQ